jgi:hypothetical protein
MDTNYEYQMNWSPNDLAGRFGDGAMTMPSKPAMAIGDRLRSQNYQYQGLKDLMMMMHLTYPQMDLEDIIRGTLLKDMNTSLEGMEFNGQAQKADLYNRTTRRLGIRPENVQRIAPPTTGSIWM